MESRNFALTAARFGVSRGGNDYDKENCRSETRDQIYIRKAQLHGLDHLEQGTLCMVMDRVKCKFGQNNNYAESELKEYLNEWYLDSWLNDGAFIADLLKWMLT